MLDDEIALWPAARQAEAVCARRFSAVDLLELYATRVERLNPVETAASHSVYVSQPEAVATLIETAVKGVS